MDLKKAGDSESDSESNALFGDAAEGMDLDGGDVQADAAELREAWPDEEPEAVEQNLETDADDECHPCEEAPFRIPTNPSDPTPEERERHNKTHVPHRPWCAICIKARGREDKHYSQTKQEMEMGLPRVDLDYAQVEDVVPSTLPEQPEEPHKKRLLIGRDRWTKSVQAHLVRCKGLDDPTIVKRVTEAVDELGYRKLIIKTDGEPALVNVQEAVARRRTHETLMENPRAYDPQANGGAERAVAEVKAQMRAIKIGLEARVRVAVDPRWPIVEWMIPHSADLINRFLYWAPTESRPTTAFTTNGSKPQYSNSESKCWPNR